MDRFHEVPVSALRINSLKILSTLLNPPKVLMSDGLPRDWRGLAFLSVEMSYEQILTMKKEKDPMGHVFEIWMKNSKDTFKTLQEYLERLDRWDIYDDVQEFLEQDAENYFKNLGNSVINVPDIVIEKDNEILTIDDVTRINQGLDTQHYDAFVLFADDDIDFATKLIEKMETEYCYKLFVKERDLVGGLSFEHEAIIRLISKRCNRLIVILSPEFLSSSSCKFFVKYAQAVGIEQQQRKIIPCMYKKCQKLPPELSFYYILDYQSSGRFWNFWDKLSNSIKTAGSSPVPEKSIVQRGIQQIASSENTLDINRIETVKCDTEPETEMRAPKVKFDENSCYGDISVESTIASEASLLPSPIPENGHKKPFKWFKPFKSFIRNKSKDGSSVRSNRKEKVAVLS